MFLQSGGAVQNESLLKLIFECLFCETLSRVGSQNWDYRHEVSIFVFLKKKINTTKTVYGKCMTQIRRFFKLLILFIYLKLTD